MLIVSDTGPLRYLIEIHAIDSLPRLYGTILTTSTVIGELQLPHFPAAVRQWAQQIPAWLKIEQPQHLDFLDRLDAGEASALSLAMERHADAVLIDERNGTTVARSKGVATIGTLAVLQEAGYAGFVDFREAIRQLTQETRFRHSRELIERITAEFDKEQRKRQGERQS
jgi:predicted nucleic acid-binding protein